MLPNRSRTRLPQNTERVAAMDAHFGMAIVGVLAARFGEYGFGEAVA